MLSVLNNAWFRVNKLKKPFPSVRGMLILVNKGTVAFGAGAAINSSWTKNIIGGDTRSSIIVRPGARLQIGHNFRMSNSAIYCSNNISIGDNVMIGGSCRIWDTDFHPLNPEVRRATPNENFVSKPIHIEDDVFIGGFSIILKGVSIGRGSVVGAGSVVSRNIPAGEIWAGNPAQFIGKVK